MSTTTKEPNISTTVAPIYAADLLYEQNCKCGTTQVLTSGEIWISETLGDNVWRIDILDTGGTDVLRPVSIFETLAATNISSADCTKLVATRFASHSSIFGDFTAITIAAAGAVTDKTVIIYKDCRQS